MEKPRIRHIAINVEDLDKTAEYYKQSSAWKKNIGGPGELFMYPTAISISLSSIPRNIRGESITLVFQSG